MSDILMVYELKALWRKHVVSGGRIRWWREGQYYLKQLIKAPYHFSNGSKPHTARRDKVGEHHEYEPLVERRLKGVIHRDGVVARV